ncbi:uncharacterized protein FA14DRAFT_177408 [Meira miltonrushii]|uniref:RNA polymerase II elongation factor ELL N-terminal domain-containing protein n=1 Tax=Meira miltonrushii TaxID=1280837 RepID=A0A316VKY7_9BASI|nr:uncharacterized protein FA14DRAFT_177408 [Meira miltonrushii]PWN38130.1 hypothetical protein FA14DRAFT_177408 [Meira miltonrushii]
MLDQHQGYLLAGEHGQYTPVTRNESRPEKVLHLRLSAEALEQLTREDVRISIRAIDDANTILTINDAQHNLQKSTEASPHHIYRLEQQGSSSRSSGYSQLSHVGEVQTKYAIRPNSTPSSTATSRLKERRELEEARKLEHRAVLLDSAPVSNKPSKSTSGLKLRAKGLAPANKGSPLLQSRSGTPIDSHSQSLPGSPNIGSGHNSVQNTPTNQAKSSPLKRENSPTGLRRQLVQLLAKGPLSRRDIVRESHFAEPQVVSVLGPIANTPDTLQPKGSSVSSTRKFTGPVNRRNSVGGSIASSSDNSSHSTVYALKDECYTELLVKDWEGYSMEEKIQISARMEMALDRLGIPHNAVERDQLVRVPAEKRIRLFEKLDLGEGVSEDDHSSKSAHSARPKASTSKKPTTKDRLARAAKGKLSSPRITPVNAKQATSADKEHLTKTKAARTSLPRSADARETTMQQDIPSATKRKTTSAPRTSTSGNGSVSHKSTNRKDIEYTDSSDDDENLRSRGRALSAVSQKADTIAGDSKPLVDLTVNRPKNGSISSLNLAREPWLEVRSTKQWHELAKRFHRVYDEYQKGLSRVRDEEDMIKSELRLANKEEEEKDVSSRGNRRDSVSSRNTRSTRGNKAAKDEDEPMLSPSDEREEGEASPTIGQDAQMSSTTFAWRHGGVKATQAFPSSDSQPMPLEDLEDLVGSVLELEGQLRRMKTVLQTSKEDLEA